MRPWIADIVSRLRRLFVRGRSQRVQDRGRRERPSAGEAPREIEVALDQQTPDTAAGSADNSAIPHQAIKDPQSGATQQEVHRGLKTDRTPGQECAPSGASNAEATALVTSDVLESEDEHSTIAEDLVKPVHARELGHREPGSIVPDSPPFRSLPEAHPSGIQAPDLTASTSPIEPDNLEGSVNLPDPGRSVPTRHPMADHVMGGAESDHAPVPQAVPDATALPDSETTVASSSRSRVPQSRSSRRVAPEKRGGRPRGTDGLADKAGPGAPTDKRDVARSCSSRPELVCWKEGMAWVVGVEVPDELAEQDLRVLDGEDNGLERDQLHELRWRLMDPLGPVTVRWSDAVAMEGNRHFDANSYRVLKLARSGVSGRCVSRVTRGNYVVIAPRELTRDEAVGGTARVAPENVIPEQAGIVAHYLLVEGEKDGLVLNGSGTASVEVRPSTATAYGLIGHMIEDAHTGAGPLFGREPPRFRVEGAPEPALFVVGVEGPSPGRRSRQAATSFDELRNWLDDKQPGWFFALYTGICKGARIHAARRRRRRSAVAF